MDDSPFIRSVIINHISKDPRFHVVGFAENAHDAAKKVTILRPDVMTLDVEMPGPSGLEFLKHQMKVAPLPVVIVSSLNISIFQALSLGAVDVVQKVGGDKASGQLERFLNDIIEKLVTASNSNPTARNNLPEVTSNVQLRSTPALDKIVIALGASTGGTEAILEVLKQMPADSPGFVIVQHMPKGFTKLYADRITKLVPMTVKEAEHGDRIQRGRVLIAPGGFHMTVSPIGLGYQVNLHEGTGEFGKHEPSVDVLFESVAKYIPGKSTIGVILTGMGADGARGMLSMHRGGAYTVGQSRESCVVYGMPMEAKALGGVSTEGALQNIPNLIKNRLNRM